MGIKRCPACGGIQFKAEVTYGAIVESQEDGTFKILSQGQNCYIRPVECGCGRKFQDASKELVEAVQCSVCGKYTDNVDENGKCEICRLLEVSPQYANMSTDELLRCIFKQQQEIAQQKANDKIYSPKNPVTQQPADTASYQEQAKQNTEQNNASEISDTAKAKVESAQEAVTNAKTGGKKGRPRKKKKDEAVEKENNQQEQQPVPEQQTQGQEQPSYQVESALPPNQQMTGEIPVVQEDDTSWMADNEAMAQDPFSNAPDLNAYATQFEDNVQQSQQEGEDFAMFGDNGQQAY